MSLKERICR